jgi:hypothetical protein
MDCTEKRGGGIRGNTQTQSAKRHHKQQKLKEFGEIDKVGISVGIATGYALDGLGSISGSARFFSSQQHPDRLRPTRPSYPMDNGGSWG